MSFVASLKEATGQKNVALVGKNSISIFLYTYKKRSQEFFIKIKNLFL
jgi:hypothetical protein